MDAAGRSRWLHPRRKLVAGAGQPSRGGVVRHIQQCQPVFLTVQIFQPAQLDISSDARGFFIKVTIRSRGLLRKLTCLSWVSVSLKYVRAGKRDKSTEVTGLCSSPSSRSRVNRSMPQVLATPLQKMLRTSSTEMMPKPSVPDAVKVTV